MKKILFAFTILILIIGTFGIPELLVPRIHSESMCPSNMEPDSRECLDYLRKKLAEANTQQVKLSDKLEDEQYKQLSLQQKISYITTQIEQTEKVINTLNMEITTQDIEITLLANEIQKSEDQLGLLNQEVKTLERTANERITESYKYSYVGAFEFLFDVKNLDSIVRKTKYLIITRLKDKNSLEKLADKMIAIEKEEEVLALQKSEIQIKRNNLEIEKVKLSEEKNNLDIQKSEKNRLLAESKALGEKLLSELNKYRSLQAAYDNEIMAYIAEHGESIADYGWVTKGTPIGYVNEGPSAPCSTGTHLHFSIDQTTTSYWNGCGKLNTFGSGYLVKGTDYWLKYGDWYYYYIRSGSMRVPLGGTVILTGTTHYGSTSCPSPRYAIDITSTLWSNIPVYAAMDGNLKKGKDKCGDTYAIIENPDTKLRTAYFHMK